MKMNTLWLCLGFGLLAACGGDKGDSAGTTEEADADTDADTDADVNGTLSIDVTADVAGTVYEDTCVGTLTASDDGTTVSGTGTCSFSGPLGALISGEQTGVMTGTIDGGNASGTYDISTTIGANLDMAWTGTTDGTTMNGTFEGTTTIDAVGADVDYVGTFTYDN